MSKKNSSTLFNQQVRKEGKHIIAEFWQCQCDDDLLCQTQQLLPLLMTAVDKVGLCLVGKTAHEFNPANDSQTPPSLPMQNAGLTISLLLAESHLCLHTWGERKTATLDIYVCNYLQDNSQKAQRLFEICREILKPQDYNEQTIKRYHFSPH